MTYNHMSVFTGAMARRASDGGANIQQFVHWYQHAEHAATNHHHHNFRQPPPSHTQQPHLFSQAAPGFGSAPFGGEMMMMPQYPGSAAAVGMSSSIQSTGTSPDEDDEEDKEAIRRFVFFLSRFGIKLLVHMY